MKRAITAVAIVLFMGSVAMGQWGYVAVPAPVVVAAPPAVVVPAPMPVTSYYWPSTSYYYPAPAPVVVAPGPVYYPGRVVVRSRYYPYGQPVRNVVRAVLPPY